MEDRKPKTALYIMCFLFIGFWLSQIRNNPYFLHDLKMLIPNLSDYLFHQESMIYYVMSWLSIALAILGTVINFGIEDGKRNTIRIFSVVFGLFIGLSDVSHPLNIYAEILIMLAVMGYIRLGVEIRGNQD